MQAKFTLQRIRLNSGGYTSKGVYFGTGAPLYYYADHATGEIASYLRAYDRKDAKDRIRNRHPGATFVR